MTAVSLVILGLIAAARRTTLRQAFTTRSPLVFYAAATVVLWALACGPVPEGASLVGRLRPYSLLMWLPGFNGLRAPARFAMLASLTLAVAAGLALRSVTAGRRIAPAVWAAIAILGLSMDGWMKPLPLVNRPGRILLPDVQDAIVLELPCDDEGLNVSAMYRAMLHGRPLINGYSGYAPPHYRILGHSMRRGDSSAVLELARGRPIVILISEPLDPDRRFERMVEALPGIRAYDSTGAGRMYVLPAQPRGRPPALGVAKPFTLHETRAEHVELDLGREEFVRSVEFPLWWHYDEMGERIAVEASNDRVTWTTVWENWTAGPALAGALEDERKAVVRLPVADVKTRYLRIHPAPVWMQRELTVYGPR
jgi:hypothetical protein